MRNAVTKPHPVEGRTASSGEGGALGFSTYHGARRTTTQGPHWDGMRVSYRCAVRHHQREHHRRDHDKGRPDSLLGSQARKETERMETNSVEGDLPISILAIHIRDAEGRQRPPPEIPGATIGQGRLSN